MAYTSGQLKADVQRKIHGAVSQSVFDSLNEAARWLLTTIDPYETKRQRYLEYGLFDHLNSYYLPIDCKDQKIIDIRRQINQNNQWKWVSFANISNRTFRKYENIQSGYGAYGTYTIEPLDNVKYIRIKDRMQNTTLNINTCDSLTDNGTWNVYGGLNNLTVDTLNYVQGNAALRFDISSGTFGAIEVTGQNSANIESYEVSGSLFFSLYVPNPANLVSVTLKWGSSGTDFYSFTVTAPHNNTTWLQGWNVLKFPFDQPNVFGNPNPQAITMERIEFQTTGQPLYNMRIDNICARQAVLYEILYYSSYLFSDSQSGDWKQESYDPGDILNVSLTSYNLLMLKTAIIQAQEVKNSATDIQVLSADLAQALDSYLMDNKSEYIKPQEAWYKPIDPARTFMYPWGMTG